MKKIFVLCLMLMSVSLFALDGIFVGLGFEANANTRENAAAGSGLSFGFDLSRDIGIGLKASYSNNFDTVGNLESFAFFRWYLPLAVSGLFLQADAGGSFFFEDGEYFPAFLGGLTTGWRFILGKNFYLEPFARGGYPFAWAGGINFGLYFYQQRNSAAVINR